MIFIGASLKADGKHLIRITIIHEHLIFEYLSEQDIGQASSFWVSAYLPIFGLSGIWGVGDWRGYWGDGVVLLS